MLVANRPADQRFNEASFLSAPSAFQNLDVKYEVNRLRSRAYAASHIVGMVYSVAKDTPSSDVACAAGFAYHQVILVAAS